MKDTGSAGEEIVMRITWPMVLSYFAVLCLLGCTQLPVPGPAPSAPQKPPLQQLKDRPVTHADWCFHVGQFQYGNHVFYLRHIFGYVITAFDKGHVCRRVARKLPLFVKVMEKYPYPVHAPGTRKWSQGFAAVALFRKLAVVCVNVRCLHLAYVRDTRFLQIF